MNPSLGGEYYRWGQQVGWGKGIGPIPCAFFVVHKAQVVLCVFTVILYSSALKQEDMESCVLIKDKLQMYSLS